MFQFIRQRLGIKLFLSYLMILGIGILTLMFVAQFTIPTAFARHMNSMMGMNGMMMGNQNAGDDLFVNFQAGAWEAIGWASAALFLVSAGVSIWVSRRIMVPVLAIDAASQKIAAGSYDERVNIIGNPKHGDELIRLSQNFNRMAAQLDRTEARRRQLIGDVAHELRTPLTTIKGSMEGLMDGVLPAQPETFQEIYREADRLQRLVNDLQELSRIEAQVVPIKKQELDLGHLVETVVQKLRPQFEEKGVLLEVGSPKDLPGIPADPDRITQVLMNLLGNALQYTPGGGRVSISVHCDNDNLLIKVEDNGIGISAEQLPLVFDRFYRADKSRARSGGGSGIGLTISQHLVEVHGGTINIASEGENKGSTVTLTLPRN
jgi:histidine kinase